MKPYDTLPMDIKIFFFMLKIKLTILFICIPYNSVDY